MKQTFFLEIVLFFISLLKKELKKSHWICSQDDQITKQADLPDQDFNACFMAGSLWNIFCSTATALLCLEEFSVLGRC